MAQLEAFLVFFTVALVTGSPHGGIYENPYSLDGQAGNPYYVIRPQHLLPPAFSRSQNDVLTALTRIPEQATPVRISVQPENSAQFTAVPVNLPQSPVPRTLVPLTQPLNYYKFVRSDSNKNEGWQSRPNNEQQARGQTSAKDATEGAGQDDDQQVFVDIKDIYPTDQRNEKSNSRERSSNERKNPEQPRDGASVLTESSDVRSQEEEMQEALTGLVRELLKSTTKVRPTKVTKTSSRSSSRKSKSGSRGSSKNRSKEEVFTRSESRSQAPGYSEQSLPLSRDSEPQGPLLQQTAQGPLDGERQSTAGTVQITPIDDGYQYDNTAGTQQSAPSPSGYDEPLRNENLTPQVNSQRETTSTAPVRVKVDTEEISDKTNESDNDVTEESQVTFQVKTQSAGRTTQVRGSGLTNSEEAARDEVNSAPFGERETPRRNRPRPNSLVQQEQTEVEVRVRGSSREKSRPSSTKAKSEDYYDDYSEEDQPSSVIIEQTARTFSRPSEDPPQQASNRQVEQEDSEEDSEELEPATTEAPRKKSKSRKSSRNRGEDERRRGQDDSEQAEQRGSSVDGPRESSFVDRPTSSSPQSSGSSSAGRPTSSPRQSGRSSSADRQTSSPRQISGSSSVDRPSPSSRQSSGSSSADRSSPSSRQSSGSSSAGRSNSPSPSERSGARSQSSSRSRKSKNRSKNRIPTTTQEALTELPIEATSPASVQRERVQEPTLERVQERVQERGQERVQERGQERVRERMQEQQPALNVPQLNGGFSTVTVEQPFNPYVTNVVPGFQPSLLQPQTIQLTQVTNPYAAGQLSNPFIPLLSLNIQPGVVSTAAPPTFQYLPQAPSIQYGAPPAPSNAPRVELRGPVGFSVDAPVVPRPARAMTIPPAPTSAPQRSSHEIENFDSDVQHITKELSGIAGNVEYKLTPSIRYEVDESDRVLPSRDDEPPRTISYMTPVTRPSALPPRPTPAPITFSYSTIQATNPRQYADIMKQLPPATRNALVSYMQSRLSSQSNESPRVVQLPEVTSSQSPAHPGPSWQETINLVARFASAQANGVDTVSNDGRITQFSISPSQVHHGGVHTIGPQRSSASKPMMGNPNAINIVPAPALGRPPTVLQKVNENPYENTPHPPNQPDHSLNSHSDGHFNNQISAPTEVSSEIEKGKGRTRFALFKTIENIIRGSFTDTFSKH